MSKVFQMLGGSCGSIKLASIEITTPPTKTAYKAGEQFSTAGMVVKATYSNGATLIATGVSVEPSCGLEAGRTSVTIRWALFLSIRIRRHISSASSADRAG